MPDLTIAIPVANYHKEQSALAVASVQTQTVETALAIYYDSDEKGPGFARNELLNLVSTPFVAFLDADDYIDRRFTEILLPVARYMYSKNQYIYTSWVEHFGNRSEKIDAETQCYCLDKGIEYCHTHLITAILPTIWALETGGFDEELTGIEDTDFWFKVHRNHCGYLIDNPLIHWNVTSNDRRSVRFQRSPEINSIKDRIRRRYEGLNMCCGQNVQVSVGPFNDKQPGDVLVAVNQGAKIPFTGRASGRIYPPSGYGELVWADPRDVMVEPNKLQIVQNSNPPAPEQTIAQAVNNVMLAKTQQAIQKMSDNAPKGAVVYDSPAAQNTESTPRHNIQSLINKAGFGNE